LGGSRWILAMADADGMAGDDFYVKTGLERGLSEV
jgi:hypothetical protein